MLDGPNAVDARITVGSC